MEHSLVTVCSGQRCSSEKYLHVSIPFVYSRAHLHQDISDFQRFARTAAQNELCSEPCCWLDSPVSRFEHQHCFPLTSRTPECEEPDWTLRKALPPTPRAPPASLHPELSQQMLTPGRVPGLGANKGPSTLPLVGAGRRAGLAHSRYSGRGGKPYSRVGRGRECHSTEAGRIFHSLKHLHQISPARKYPLKPICCNFSLKSSFCEGSR